MKLLGCKLTSGELRGFEDKCASDIEKEEFCTEIRGKKGKASDILSWRFGQRRSRRYLGSSMEEHISLLLTLVYGIGSREISVRCLQDISG